MLEIFSLGSCPRQARPEVCQLAFAKTDHCVCCVTFVLPQHLLACVCSLILLVCVCVNRAEATDVANAVLDGTDGVLLGAETLRGKYPAITIKTVLAICRQAEEVFDYSGHFELLTLTGEKVSLLAACAATCKALCVQYCCLM